MRIFLILLGICFELYIIFRFIVWFYKEYKSSENSSIQVLMILIFVSVFFPLVIFFLDRYNFFSNIGYLENIDSDNWHSFLATYGSSLVSALIGAGFLVVVTGIQMDRSKEDNDDLAKKQLRLQNIPVLKFKVNYENNSKNGPTIVIDDQLSDVRELTFVNINIKNIGLGIAQNIKYFAVVDTINTFEINQDISIAYHNKDEEIVHSIYFNVPAVENYNKNILLLLYYDDLLGNNYVQKFDCCIHSYSSSDLENSVSFSCNVTTSGDNKYITESYSYKDEKEYLRMKSNEEHNAEQEKKYKIVKDKDKLDLIISEYLQNDVNVIKLIADYFIDIFPNMEGGGTTGSLNLKDDKYIEVIGTYSMGISSSEFISVTNTLTLDVKTLKFVSFKLKVVENTLKISQSDLKKFERYLEKIDNRRN